jgi:hypothetical protein
MNFLAHTFCTAGDRNSYRDRSIAIGSNALRTFSVVKTEAMRKRRRNNVRRVTNSGINRDHRAHTAVLEQWLKRSPPSLFFSHFHIKKINK